MDPNSDKQPAENPNSPDGAPQPSSFKPPSPGQVITSHSPASTPEAPSHPRIVTSHHGGGKKRGLKILIILIVLALIGGGYYLYKKHQDNAKVSTTTQSRDIPLLKIGMLSADYGNLYPNMSANEYAYIVNAQMFEGLVRYQNKSKVVPDLASNWTNPDAKTWIFTLQPGVKFHDGHTLQASDVKYSLDTIMANNSDIGQTYASTISAVDVTGKDTVKITTKDPDPALLNKLTYLYIIDQNLPKGDEPSQAGTGAYEIKPGTTLTSTNVQMVAAAHYHGVPPTTKALDFGSKDDASALVKAFQAGQFNIIGPVPPKEVKKVPGATEFISEEADVNFLGLNTVAPGPLQNKQVREAIRYAVSPSAIAKANGAQGTPTAQLIPDSIPGFNPSIKPYKQDVAKAKQLLAQAGYPNGLTIKLSSSSDQEEVAEIAAELKAIGITVTIDSHPDFDEFINYFTSGQAQMFLVQYGSDTLDGLDVYQSTIISDYYNNPRLTSLLDQASTENDPAKRLKLLQQAATIINQDAPVIPLYGSNDIWLMDKPYDIHQDMPAAYISVYFSGVQLK